MDLKTKSIGLVLSEEFKGLAHAGVLKFWKSKKIKLSSRYQLGSIVGLLMLGAKQSEDFRIF
jgi:hypothetical protein